MASNVVNFPSRGAGGASKSLHEARLAEHEKAGEEAGETLKTSRKKLSWDDRIRIAKRLHEEIVASGVKSGRLAEAAKFPHGTRDLSKTRLKDGQQERQKAQLFAHTQPYYYVIDQLARITKQNFRLLADRITMGTAVHPTRVDGLNEIEKTFRALELLADRVDRELGLFEQLRETLQLKLESLARGDMDNWPNYDLDEDDIPPKPLLSATHAFWIAGSDEWSPGPDLDALAYLPHAYLGIIADWKAMGIEDDLVAMRAFREAQISGYDHVPQVRVSRETGFPLLLSAEVDPDRYEHAWLILYPNAKMTSVIPVLLITNPDLGTTAERLSVSKLIDLEEVELIGKRPRSVYDRILELVGERTVDGSDYALVQAWIETGRRLRQNPFLRELEKMTEMRANRDKLFTEGEYDENE